MEKEIQELRRHVPNFFQPKEVIEAYNYGPRRAALDAKLEAIRNKKREIGYLTGFTPTQKAALKQQRESFHGENPPLV